jgi:UDP-sulfoquinovose synthase
MWKLRVTDLMQGPVYGISTYETGKDERLFPFVNYDEIFGTVLNRFMVQAVAGHPLTVYGKGGQTRGFLNIKDTLQCVLLSLEDPAQKGELRIYNQFVELFSINQLAAMVQRVGNQLGLKVQIRSVENPRKEAEEHYYNPAHQGLLELGLQPHYLTDDVLAEMIETIARFKTNIQEHKIVRRVKWD